ncbi:hypothetical protein J6590_044927 [Homalodisca vitripennis]|nr:hypothetical protein J6590_044927 [Homalodisca vitripennis]
MPVLITDFLKYGLEQLPDRSPDRCGVQLSSTAGELRRTDELRKVCGLDSVCAGCDATHDKAEKGGQRQKDGGVPVGVEGGFRVSGERRGGRAHGRRARLGSQFTSIHAFSVMCA